MLALIELRQNRFLDTIGASSSTESSHTESPVKKGLNKAEEAEYASIMEELPKLEHLVKRIGCHDWPSRYGL